MARSKMELRLSWLQEFNVLNRDILVVGMRIEIKWNVPSKDEPLLDYEIVGIPGCFFH